MKKIAITGSFASGKSFVLDKIRLLGYETFSCDEYVKSLYEIKEIKEIVCKIIGLKIFDKKELINIIYNQDMMRIKLGQIIHPKVRIGMEKFAVQNNNEKLLFFEVPLLFENNFDSYFDYSICIYCDEEIRRQRAGMRKNFNEFVYEKIKQIQSPQEEKCKRADFKIKSQENDIDIINKIKQIISRLK